jgi:hypothetical protein
MTLEVVAGRVPGESMHLATKRTREEESLSRALELAGDELAGLRRQAWRAFDHGHALEVCQDPVEDVLAALSRARRALGSEA